MIYVTWCQIATEATEITHLNIFDAVVYVYDSTCPGINNIYSVWKFA